MVTLEWECKASLKLIAHILVTSKNASYFSNDILGNFKEMLQTPNSQKLLFNFPKHFFLILIFTVNFNAGNVVANGSFSKIAAPGLRLGWYEAPKAVLDSLEDSYVIESGAGQSYYQSFIFAEILRSGQMDEHVQMVRKLHKVFIPCLKIGQFKTKNIYSDKKLFQMNCFEMFMTQSRKSHACVKMEVCSRR